MIQLHRPTVIPNRLLTKGKEVADRDRKAFNESTTEYLSGTWSMPSADSSVYAAAAVKTKLSKMHSDKCCYCERKSMIGLEETDRGQSDEVFELHVEHFRPYGATQQSLGIKREKPGYFWLGYDWANLLLACRRCNSNNKKILFPLTDPTKRARTPKQKQKLQKEKPLFINPAIQDPRDHIRFEGASPVGHTQEGRETIEGIGLDKSDLFEKRLEYLTLILATNVVASTEAAKHPGDKELQQNAAKARTFLAIAEKPESKFSSMAIDYLAGFDF